MQLYTTCLFILYTHNVWIVIITPPRNNKLLGINSEKVISGTGCKTGFRKFSGQGSRIFLIKNWKFGYPKNFGVLYYEGVYYCVSEKWRTLLCGGLIMRFKHYLHMCIWNLDRLAFMAPIMRTRFLRTEIERVHVRPAPQEYHDTCDPAKWNRFWV